MLVPTKSKRIGWWLIAIVAFVIFAFAQNILNLVTDYFWFKEIHLTSVFSTMLFAKIGITVISGVIALVAIFVNLLLAQKLAKPVAVYGDSPMRAYIDAYGITPFVKFVMPLAAIAIAFFVATFAGQFWDVYLSYKGSVSFGATDPLLGKDISFYVFKLPFYRFVYNSAVAIIALSLAGSFIIYFLKQNVHFSSQNIHQNASIMKFH